MKKQVFTIFLIAVFSLILAEQNTNAQSGASVYSTVDYNSTNNTVSSYAYTYLTYDNESYYQAQVTSFLYDPNGNILTADTSYGNLEAVLSLSATGTGCGEYTVLSYHAVNTEYYVTYYYYYGNYVDGYYDPANYFGFSEQSQSLPYPVSFFAPAQSSVRIVNQSQIILGSTEDSDSGSCVIVQIEKVEFEQIGGPIDDHPAINGLTSSDKGKRIFPDKNSAADNTDRAKVRVKATVTPITQGVTIYFQSYDIDDPSTNSSLLDTTGSGGNDNKGLLNGKKAT